MTSEQLEASRAERMRQNGHGALTLEDARTWIEETGLCLFLPRRQFSSSVAPSFVEAVAGERSGTPDARHIAAAEELLVRLERDGIAVRLNLLGQPGEQPDFVVAAWVLPYVYALRGDRDWRRSPQLTGSRQVSPLAIQAYKQLEQGDATLSELKHALGREVTEAAVLRAITELWQQLRIIPIVSAVGQPAKWQLLRHRFQKAIAEGASTSQVTAISVLASIYLQAVIAASMEEVELFLAPLTARSKVREVLRGLVATRQVHTISLGHAPHFYVAGTLPEFTVAPTIYTSSAMPGFFLHHRDHEDDYPEPEPARSLVTPPPARIASSHASSHPPAAIPQVAPSIAAEAHKAPPEPRVAPAPAAHTPVSNGKPSSQRPHFSRPAAHHRDRKPTQSANGKSAGARPHFNRPASGSRPAGSRPSGARPSGPRPAGARPASPFAAKNGSRGASASRWGSSAPRNGGSNGNGNGAHKNGVHKPGHVTGHAANGNGNHKAGHVAGHGANGNGGRAANGANPSRNGKPSAPAWKNRNGHANGSASKPAAKSGAGARSNGLSRNGASARKDVRPVRSKNGKPALAAGAKAGNTKRYGFTSRANSNRPSSNRPSSSRSSASRSGSNHSGSSRPASNGKKRG